MDSIKNIVSGVIGQMASGDGGHFKDIQAAWVKISKDQESWASDFKDGSLTISAKTSMRLVRLNLDRESLLKALQKEFPSVKKICFKVGRAL